MMREFRRVVITGMGTLNPCGNNVETFWQNILSGKSGITENTRIDATEFSSKIAGMVKDFDPAYYIDAKEARRFDLYAQYAVAAAIMALRDAGIAENEISPEKVGVIVGSGIGGINTLLDNYKVMFEKGAKRVSPFTIPMMIPDMASALISMRYNFRGPNYTSVSACASAIHSMGECFNVIRRGDADFMITGGAEAPLHPLSIAGFCNAKALSTRNDDPQTASRPFDRDRDGFVIAEGAGILVFEALDSALSRGATIYAEILGYAATGDAYHITAPHPDGLGATEAMRKAIADAGLNIADIDYVNTHGTSTDVGDIAECAALQKVFGTNTTKPYINSTKSMTGHVLGAAGAIELIACAKTLQTGWIHPSTNIFELEPGCTGVNIVREKLFAEPKIALSNSFGFGGHNGCMVIRKWLNT